MAVDIIISVGIAAVLLFAVSQGSRIIRSGAAHKTLRKAIEQGQPLTPDMIKRFETKRAPDTGAADQRIGFVLVAIALALFGAALLNPGDSSRDLATIALFPLLVGGALLLRLRLASRRQVEP